MFKTSKIILVSFGHFMHDVYSSFISPVLPVLIKNLSLSYSQAAMLNVAFRAPSIFTPFLGIIADRISLRFFVIFGPLVSAICMCFLTECPNYLALIVVLLFCGTNVLLFHIPAPVMVRHLSGELIGKGMSFYMLGGEIARFAGPVLFVWGISTLGEHKLYYLLLPVIISTIYFFFKLKEEKVEQKPNSNFKHNNALRTLKKHSKLVVGISGIYMTAGILKASVTIFLPTYYSSLGKSLVIGGSALAIVQFFGAIGVFCAGTLSDKFSRRKLLGITVVLSSVFLIALNQFQSNQYVTIICLIGIGLSTFANGPILLATINSSDKNNPAFLNAVFMSLNLGINSLMAYSAGVLFDIYGFNTTFIIAAIANLLCLPFILFITENKAILGQ